MKKLLAIVAILISTSAQAQYIKSNRLDSLIWKEINVYRLSLGVYPVKKFNTDALRKRSYQLTNLNATLPLIDHTRGDSTFVGYNTECIYLFKTSGTSVSKKYNINVLTDVLLKEIAKIVVDAWIISPNHNYLIASRVVGESTITSIMEFGKDSFRITVSYHDLNKF